MVDIRDPKNQKIIIVIVVFLLASYGWYSEFYTKADEEMNSRYSELEQLLVSLNKVEQQVENLETLKEEYNGLLTSYGPLQKLLPDSLEFSTLLSQVHAAAQANYAIILEITPSGREKKTYYYAQEYNVKMAVNYHDLGNFLADVANLPFIVNVSDVISKKYADVSKAPKIKDKSILAEFKLTAYHAKQKAKGKAG